MSEYRYKPSYYNFIYMIRDEIWLFNSLNLGLVQIDQDLYELLTQEIIDMDNYVGEDKEYLFEFLEEGFIVPFYVDELKILEYIYNTDKYDKEYLSITIVPTLSCNCACYYCFERENNKKTQIIPNSINDKFEDEVIQYIESKLADIKSLDVAWFGGEPLLEFPKIEALSKRIIELCDKYDVQYTSSLTTNGYYIAKISNILLRLKACQIGTYQVTIDGAPKEHDKIRKLKHNGAGTFSEIITGIRMLYESGMNISVRVNISKANIENLEELFDVLEKDDLKNLKIYFGQLIDYSEKDNSELYFSTLEYSTVVQKLYILLRNRGFWYGLEEHYPTIARACIANRMNTAVIDCYGNIYKCRSQIGEFEKKVDSIYNKQQTIEEAMREINWLQWTPFKYLKCKECKYLPLCMGGCPYTLYDNEKELPVCDHWKYNLEFFIKQKVKNLEVNDNEKR